MTTSQNLVLLVGLILVGAVILELYKPQLKALV